MRTLLFLSLLTTALSAEPLPVLLNEDFSNGSNRWQPTDPTKWKIREVDGNKVFELVEGDSDYKPPFRSPLNIAFLKDKIVGSFDLTARIQTTQKFAVHRDLCFIFNY